MQGWFPDDNRNRINYTPVTTVTPALFLLDVSIYVMTRHETPVFATSHVCMCKYYV